MSWWIGQARWQGDTGTLSPRSFRPAKTLLDAVSVVDEGVEEKWMEARLSPQRQDHSHCLLHTGHAIDEAKSAMGSGQPGICQVRRKLMRDFGNWHSTSYFNADISGTGVADVVALCQFGISSLGKNLHPADVQYVTDMANFVHCLTHMQRNDLSKLLHGTVSKLKRDSDADNKCKWKTLIPTDPMAMRRQFWDGKHSFLGNIPYPTVYPVNNHAYVSLRDCIRNRLAFGFPLEKVESGEGNKFNCVLSLMQAECSQRVIRRCQRDYTEPVLVLLITEWQDGYDAHSFSKTNRGSSWIKIVTIAEPHEHKNSPEVSYHCVCSIHVWPIVVLTLRL